MVLSRHVRPGLPGGSASHPHPPMPCSLSSHAASHLRLSKTPAVRAQPSSVIIPSTRNYRSVTKSSPTLCDPTDCSTPGLPVHHQLPESIQTHVHRVGDAIQPPHPVAPSPPALSPSQHRVFPGESHMENSSSRPESLPAQGLSR